MEGAEHDLATTTGVAGIELSRTTFLKSQIDRMESQELHHHDNTNSEEVINDIAMTSVDSKKDLNIRKRS